MLNKKKLDPIAALFQRRKFTIQDFEYTQKEVIELRKSSIEHVRERWLERKGAIKVSMYLGSRHVAVINGENYDEYSRLWSEYGSWIASKEKIAGLKYEQMEFKSNHNIQHEN